MIARWGHILVLAGLLAGRASFGQGKPNITTTTLPAGTVTVAYSASLSASGGGRPYVWSITAGSLPGGLTLSGDGTIAGTPSNPGAFPFTAMVQDARGMTDSQPLTLTVNSNPVITTVSLPTGVVGASYSATLSSTGAVPPVTWAVSAGSLPANLSLSASGTIGGTPSAAGKANFTVKLSDSKGGSDTQAPTDRCTTRQKTYSPHISRRAASIAAASRCSSACDTEDSSTAGTDRSPVAKRERRRRSLSVCEGQTEPFSSRGCCDWL